MRFQAPQLGALGVTFTVLRAAQFVSLLTIIGLVANFMNEIVSAQRNAPDVLIGTLVVTSTASLYIAISYILYYDGLLPLLIAGVFDMLLMVAVIVVAATVGKPLSKLTCEALPVAGTSTIASGAQVFVASGSGVTYRSVLTKAVDYFTYVAVDQPHCYEIKAVWGLSIALCVLFAFSTLICIGLWRRVKATSAAPAKDIEGKEREAAAVGGHQEKKSVSFQFIPPPPHQIRDGDGGITGPLALTPRSLGTGTLHIIPAAASHHPTLTPSPLAPHPPAQAAHVLNFRGIDEDIAAVPPPPPMIYVARPASRGRSLTAAQRRSIAMPMIPESPISRTNPGKSSTNLPAEEDFIPIMHKRIPEKIQTQNLEVPLPRTPRGDDEDGSDDDGYTPITPAPSASSPRLKTKFPSLPSPRDALGIPISKIKLLATRSRSRRHNNSNSPADYYPSDLEPLSPSGGLPVPVVQAAREKPGRRTVWGVLEGWWDLGLLERGKSLRRK
ncbi:hypothetical protein TruAng_010039 [Truncatella angustata]|nr:hypothetical protein TruAng_010039 [Truncatella angustata]